MKLLWKGLPKKSNILNAIKESYDLKVTDEFFKPEIVEVIQG